MDEAHSITETIHQLLLSVSSSSIIRRVRFLFKVPCSLLILVALSLCMGEGIRRQLVIVHPDMVVLLSQAQEEEIESNTS